jgi:hypothetical protein
VPAAGSSDPDRIPAAAGAGRVRGDRATVPVDVCG